MFTPAVQDIHCFFLRPQRSLCPWVLQGLTRGGVLLALPLLQQLPPAWLERVFLPHRILPNSRGSPDKALHE